MNEKSLSGHGKPTAILLGGEENALSVARSLNRHGVPLVALGGHAPYLRHLRGCDCVSTNGANPQQAWFSWLMERARSSGDPDGSVLLPLSDDAVELLALRGDELSEHFLLPPGERSLHRVLLDKAGTLELAHRIGTPAPRYWRVETSSDLDEVMDDVQFPCVLKPIHSHLFQKRFGTKLIITGDREELRVAFDRVLPSELEVMVTEFIPGGDELCFAYYSYIGRDGRPLFDFTKQSLRKYPVGFGYDTYQISDENRALVEAARQFFAGIGLRGIANVEFKKDPRDGVLKLMESNPRFTRSNELLVASGIDLPHLIYEQILGEKDFGSLHYRKGTRLWVPAGDFLVFRELRKQGQITWLGWLGSLCHRQQFQIFSLRDMRPALFSLASMLGRYARRLARGLVKLVSGCATRRRGFQRMTDRCNVCSPVVQTPTEGRSNPHQD